MRNLVIGLIGAAVLGTGGYAAASGLDDADPARTVSLPGATTAAGATTTTTTTTGTTTTDEAEDVSGPCDEAEHADDPRCAGGVATGDDDDGDDHGERGGDDHDGDDDHDDENDDNDDDDDEDRSGSNSGRG